MLRPLLLLGLLTGLGQCELPCELYDVTTLVRHSEPAANRLFTPVGTPRNARLSHYLLYTKKQWEPDFPNSVYEVHSRTNAIGLQTNFENVTGVKDGLQRSGLTCLDASSPYCVGWTFEGFQNSSWFNNDSFLDWRLSKPYRDVENEFMTSNYTQNESLKASRRYDFTAAYDQDSRRNLYQSLKVRFRLGEPVFIGRSAYNGGVEIFPAQSSNQHQFEYTSYSSSHGWQTSAETPRCLLDKIENPDSQSNTVAVADLQGSEIAA